AAKEFFTTRLAHPPAGALSRTPLWEPRLAFRESGSIRGLFTGFCPNAEQGCATAAFRPLR
ncbi:MAG: hypothetical protein KGL59_09675, partial [Acidobacteriota bacterium]|nr:hypothetical protein [Acidobacteriota bacterium]